MLQKVRFATGNRDEKYMLEGILEMDEGFFAISWYGICQTPPF
jgi:hypothetical protein